MLLGEAETCNDRVAIAKCRHAFRDRKPYALRRFIIRNSGDPEQIPTMSPWDGTA